MKYLLLTGTSFYEVCYNTFLTKVFYADNCCFRGLKIADLCCLILLFNIFPTLSPPRPHKLLPCAIEMRRKQKRYFAATVDGVLNVTCNYYMQLRVHRCIRCKSENDGDLSEVDGPVSGLFRSKSTFSLIIFVLQTFSSICRH